MTDNDSDFASAITPRMSICVRANKDVADALTEYDYDDSISGPSLELSCITDKMGIGNTTERHLFSSSSILLTGTPFSILSTSSNDQTRERRKDNTVRFSPQVHVRIHLHCEELTMDEKVSAWFSRPEYRKIYKNNIRIIQSIGQREKELKKAMKKKKKEQQRQKRRNMLKFKKGKSSSSRLHDSCTTSISYDPVEDTDCDDEHKEYIVALARDEDQGYSTRGLENETSSKRDMRDDIYIRCKYVVLSLQADVDLHMETMQIANDRKLKKIEKRSKSKLKRGRRSRRTLPEEESESIRDLTATTKFEFAAYAQDQYNKMALAIAQQYGGICRQHAEDAHKRGLDDERTAAAIRFLENSPHKSQFGPSNRNKSFDSESGRRLSSSSTAETEEVAATASEEFSCPPTEELSMSMNNNEDDASKPLATEQTLTTKQSSTGSHSSKEVKSGKRFLWKVM
jgi:hypothetical protein